MGFRPRASARNTVLLIVVTAVAVLLDGTAYASTALANVTPVVTTATNSTYTATTYSPFWSVVAVRPSSGPDYDINVGGPASIRGGTSIDFVAINNNICTPTTYNATAIRYAGTGSGTVEFANQTPDSDSPILGTIFQPGYGGNGDFIGVYDAYLQAGRMIELYAAHVGGYPGDVYIMSSDPADPSTCLRTAIQALVHGTVNKDGHHSLDVMFTVPRSAWYGVIQTSDAANPDGRVSTVALTYH